MALNLIRQHSERFSLRNGGIMPGRIWSQQQLESLQRQLEKGKWVPDIKVYGKEAGAIRGKAYELGFSYGKNWTPEEELILRRQINTGREVDQISIGLAP